MIDALFNLASGFKGLISFMNLVAVFAGAAIGTIVGILPGLGPAATIAILLPLTLGMGPTAGLIMLAGIFFGSQYGGAITSILLRIPGEASSVMTCLDGYEMTKRGRAGAALTASAVGSFFAATIGFVGLTLFAIPLARFALKFGPPEFFVISVVGLSVLIGASGGSFLKNLTMVVLGLMLSSVGTDPIVGSIRFDFGFSPLSKGIDYVPVLIGIFGMAEVIHWTITREKYTEEIKSIRFRDLYPTREEWRRMMPAIFRGGVIGFFVGLLPGPGAITATYVSYAVEKKTSKRPEEFGHGAIEGVAGPESANNAGSVGQMVPLLALGLPFSAVTAMMLGALQMQGIATGPMFIVQQPDIFWTLIASFYVGNLVLLCFNLPLIGIFALVLRTPMWVLMSVVTLLCIVGTYSLGNEMIDVWIMVIFGVIGFFMRRFEYEAAPLVLGMVFGPIMEGSLSQSMILFQGNILGLWGRPVSASILSIAILIFLPVVLIKVCRRK